MKKAPLIALGLLVILGGIYLAVAKAPDTTVNTPLTVAPVEDLARVEVILPESAETAMVVFERRDNHWWLSRPVQARVNAQTEQTLNTLFSAPIKTDDLKLSPEKADTYQLDPSSAARISAYAGAATEPAVDLLVGKEIEIPHTRVKRTYIKKPDAPGIYRAQVALGEFVRSPVEALRHRGMVELDPAALSALTLESAAGAGAIKLRHDGARWALLEPTLQAIAPDAPEEIELDQNKVDALARSIATLRAAGFADDQDPAEAGLEPAKVTVQIEADGQTHQLRLGAETDDKKVFARFDDGPVFTINQTLADRLHPEARSLVKPVEAAQAAEEVAAQPPTAP